MDGRPRMFEQVKGRRGALTRADGSKMLPVAMQSSVTSVLPTSAADLTSQLWQLMQLRSVYPETQKTDFTMKHVF